MPIKVAVENTPDYGVIVYRYFGRVTLDDIVEAGGSAFGQLQPEAPFRVLLIFSGDVDLSELDLEALEAIHARGNAEIVGHRLGPRRAAAVLDHSADAALILPLFNALSLSGGGIDMSFDPFVEVAPALERLGIPIKVGRALIAKVE